MFSWVLGLAWFVVLSTLADIWSPISRKCSSMPIYHVYIKEKVQRAIFSLSSEVSLTLAELLCLTCFFITEYIFRLAMEFILVWGVEEVDVTFVSPTQSPRSSLDDLFPRDLVLGQPWSAEPNKQSEDFSVIVPSIQTPPPHFGPDMVNIRT